MCKSVFALCCAVCFVALLLITPPVRAAGDGGGAAGKQPDILIIMPDQMRGDCLSILHHPVIQTPTLDALAREGVLFRRGYSPVPSCIPARYALLTGLSPQVSGVVGFRAKTITMTTLSGTLPGALSKAGYRSVLVGRYMHQPKASGDLGFDQRILGSTYIADDDYDRYLKTVEPTSGGIRHVVLSHGLTFNLWQATAWPLKDQEHPTDWIVRESRKIIAEASQDKPLFLTTSFYAPHSPLFPPSKYFDKLMKMDLPKPAFGDWEDKSKLSPDGNRVGDRILLEGEKRQRAEAGYFGLIEQIDTQIAPLIAEFKARAEKAGRPWVIVFTSDHGEMLGDHGYYRKCEPYEGSANIPFIIAASPSLGIDAGGRSMEPVTLTDLMPTLLSLAHVPAPHELDGVDLTPALHHAGAELRSVLHFEHAPCYSKAQAFQALTDGRYKYIWRTQDGSEQLFDLEKDPHENHNLVKDASEASRVAAWRDRLIKILTPRPEGFVKDGHLVAGRPYPALNAGVPRAQNN